MSPMHDDSTNSNTDNTNRIKEDDIQASAVDIVGTTLSMFRTISWKDLLRKAMVFAIIDAFLDLGEKIYAASVQVIAISHSTSYLNYIQELL